MHYYRLANPEFSPASRTAVVLTVRDLLAQGAYRDDRIAYRSGPERLDYYYYHRWTADPGRLLGDYFRRAYLRSGRFAAVTVDQTPSTSVVLDGQLMALEEVDRTAQAWSAELELELYLEDGRTGELIWAKHFREQEPLRERSPAGVARAVSDMLGRIVESTAPEIATQGERALGRQRTSP